MAQTIMNASLWDDDEWQDMPVLRSSTPPPSSAFDSQGPSSSSSATGGSSSSSASGSEDDDDDGGNIYARGSSRQANGAPSGEAQRAKSDGAVPTSTSSRKKGKAKARHGDPRWSAKHARPVPSRYELRMVSSDGKPGGTGAPATAAGKGKGKDPASTIAPPELAVDDGDIVDPLALGVSSRAANNATGVKVDVDRLGREWRERREEGLDEMDYTRVELDEDPDEDILSMRTQYLFDNEKEMTPLSQMQQTKTLLSEGQRIAYVGLCKLITREMVQTLRLAARGAKELQPAVSSAQFWADNTMNRLYFHMDVTEDEQKMIEQLAEHGVTADDLVPALKTTHTVENPEYDPEVEREMAEQEESDRIQREEEEAHREEEEAKERAAQAEQRLKEADQAAKFRRLEADMEAVELERQQDESWDADGPSTPRAARMHELEPESPAPAGEDDDNAGPATPKLGPQPDPPPRENTEGAEEEEADPSRPPELLEHPAESSVLPGVTTSLTAADKTVTLDIRWTVLCDLFLSLITDAMYDARSRVMLGDLAQRLGLGWMDVIRFERRLTEALEVQEGLREKDHSRVLELARKKGRKARYAMMGAAALGGGLVIGLSAGLLAPVIGAGIGAVFTGIGVTGTTSFLAGAGGAAVITSGGVLTGSAIGGRAMGKRTRNVRTFEVLPLHNNKRLNAIITIPGFMSGPLDDVRLPYSTLDPVAGDVYSILWEPDMMGETGNAFKILTSEVLTQVGQQVLAMTVMTMLMSALQWPIVLTKLGYLIDNPWSNALDRARQAAKVLADILIDRRLGVRPITLIGFSLGARLIFYTLVELAKRKAYGVVQEVYLFGATVTASRKVWRQARGVVAGRFVNGYASNDWVLGYLFRATTGGLNTVAGLRPVENIPELENVDLTDLLTGHLSYRNLMPLILKRCGFKVTADHFDEPDDFDIEGDREVLTPEEEARRREKRERGRFGFLRRKKKTAEAPQEEQETRKAADVYDDDGLPPRESQDSVSSTASSSTGDLPAQEQAAPHRPQPAPGGPAPTAGFNLDKLREEAARAAKEELARPGSVPSTPATVTAPELPRPGSAVDVSTPAPSEPAQPAAATRAHLQHRDDDDIDDDDDEKDEIAWRNQRAKAWEQAAAAGAEDPREALRRQWAQSSSSSAGAAPTFAFAGPDGDVAWNNDTPASTRDDNAAPDVASNAMWSHPVGGNAANLHANPW